MIAVRIGIIPLVDAATIVAAKELGLFAAEGLDVVISVEPSWATLRDKLAAGALDAAHLLAPMALASGVGLGPFAERVITALSLGRGGNVIALSSALARDTEPGWDAADHAHALARVVAARRAQGAAPLRFATVFPYSMHEYELRYWLASAGIDPARDVRIQVVPPPRMVEALQADAIDGFCVGEPWGSVAVARGCGAIVATKHEIWSHAPEKVLGVRERWAERNADVHAALLRALLRASRWCDQQENRADLVRFAARWIGAPVESIAPSLLGSAERMSFSRWAAGFPWHSHAAWILVQMLRWGQIAKPFDVRGVAAEIHRVDLHRQAAADLGIATPYGDDKVEGSHAEPWTDPAGVALGADRFLDGRVFDAGDVCAYLRADEIHARRVSLDELAKAQSIRR